MLDATSPPAAVIGVSGRARPPSSVQLRGSLGQLVCRLLRLLPEARDGSRSGGMSTGSKKSRRAAVTRSAREAVAHGEVLVMSCGSHPRSLASADPAWVVGVGLEGCDRKGHPWTQ